MRNFAISIAAVSAATLIATADADQVDRYLEAQIRALHLSGLSIAVMRDGKLIKTQGYGFANLELKAPATKSTVYEIGSVTKQFTVAAIMLLVEEGKLRLDDSVTQFFSEAPETWRPITIHHLLTHTSGIQNHVGVPGYLNAFKTSITGEETPTRAEMVKMFFALPLEFEPGETWAYDNTGFILLGFIIEKASGKTYWDFLDERLFRPAGMTATRSTAVESLVPNRAAGYTWVKDHFENRPVLLPFIAFSAGSILSTAEDMAKWDVALTNGKIVKASSLEEMWTPTKLRDAAPAPFDYGFGWFLNEQRGHRIVEHTGGTPGFSCVFYRFPDDKLSVIILANHGDCVLDQLAIEIAGMYVPALKRPESATDPEPQLSSKLEQIFAGLLKGEHDNDAFTPAMQQFFATATGKSFWQWFAEHGELTSFTFSEREDRADARILRYRVRLDGNLYWLTAHLTKGGKIAQLYLW